MAQQMLESQQEELGSMTKKGDADKDSANNNGVSSGIGISDSKMEV